MHIVFRLRPRLEAEPFRYVPALWRGSFCFYPWIFRLSTRFPNRCLGRLPFKSELRVLFHPSFTRSSHDASELFFTLHLRRGNWQFPFYARMRFFALLYYAGQ